MTGYAGRTGMQVHVCRYEATCLMINLKSKCTQDIAMHSACSRLLANFTKLGEQDAGQLPHAYFAGSCANNTCACSDLQDRNVPSARINATVTKSPPSFSHLAAWRWAGQTRQLQAHKWIKHTND